MILAPLRGVTIRCFRRTFADELAEAGFDEAITPFITATGSYDPLGDRELRGCESIKVTPQFIGKDPTALRRCLERIKSAGYSTADLNAGCPFPMIRRKGRGSGLLRTPDVLARMLETGCEVMGDGAFSLKTRLGVDQPGELLALMPIINAFPLRFLTVHARTARQMYEGECDRGAFCAVEAAAKMPVVYNGDAPLSSKGAVMGGRAFVRSLGECDNSGEIVRRYTEASMDELSGDRPVLGRIKELVSYWKDSPKWRHRWQSVKIARTVDELLRSI